MSNIDNLIASLHIGSLDIKEKFNIELSFTEESFIIYFLQPLKENNIREIKNLFFPFISSDYRTIRMNYLYIKTIFLDGANILKLTMHNPTSISIFPLIFNRFKIKNKLIFSKSVPSPKAMNSLVLDIKKRYKNQTLKNINNFINIINTFYEFRSIERKYNNIINDNFLKAFGFGMIYYEKTTKEYKLSQEKIKLFRIENQKEINELNKLKNLLSTQVTENIDNNNNSSDIDREDNNENKNLELTSDIYTELNIDSVNQKDLFQNYPVFEKFSPDIKKMTSYFTEITMNLVFKVLNVNIDQLDQKNNKLNTTVNGRIINQKKCFNNISQNDIDKFLVNIKKSSSDKIIIKNINEDKINEWFDFIKEFQAFLPNNSMENIVSNTSQVIQRKFFEFIIKIFFSDIITIEVDKNKALTSDEFHQILKVLRRIKLILFTNKNIEYYEEFYFLNEEQNSFMFDNNLTFV